MEHFKTYLLRLLISVAITFAAYWLTAIIPHPIVYHDIDIGDIGSAHIGFRLWQQSGDAYVQTFTDGRPLTLYPFTTMLLLSPISLLPLQEALPVFNAVSSGILAWAILKYDHPWRLLLFLSCPYIESLGAGQWSPLFTAALLMPNLLPIAVAKPQIGVALISVGKWRLRYIIVTVMFVALSFILYPGWLIAWLTKGNLSAYRGWLPVLTGPGVLLLLTLLRPESRDSRLLLTMSFAPQRLWYDQLLLFSIPNSFREMLILIYCSWAAKVLCTFVASVADFACQPLSARIAVVLFLYFPALIMIFNPYRRK